MSWKMREMEESLGQNEGGCGGGGGGELPWIQRLKLRSSLGLLSFNVVCLEKCCADYSVFTWQAWRCGIDWTLEGIFWIEKKKGLVLLYFKFPGFIVLTQCKLLLLGYDLFFVFYAAGACCHFQSFHCLYSVWLANAYLFIWLFSTHQRGGFLSCFGCSHHLNVLATKSHSPISGLVNSPRWRAIFMLCLTPGITFGLVLYKNESFLWIQVESCPFRVQLQCQSSNAAGWAYGGVIKM